MDESCGSELHDLLKKGREWEAKYLDSLPRPGMLDILQLSTYHCMCVCVCVAGESVHQEEGALDCLQTAARCYGTALKCSPQSLEAHLALGLVMEEFFYAEDLFGLKKAVSNTETFPLQVLQLFRSPTLQRRERRRYHRRRKSFRPSVSSTVSQYQLHWLCN